MIAITFRTQTTTPTSLRPTQQARYLRTPLPATQAKPQLYSQSFRSTADRLVVNKPPNTTHPGLGPGCYDLSKDGKSVCVKTEKRVGRGGAGVFLGPTNPFFLDWRAYMQQKLSPRDPPAPANRKNKPSGHYGKKVGGGDDSGGYGDGRRRCCSSRSSRSAAPPWPTCRKSPATPQRVSYTTTHKNIDWFRGKQQATSGGGREGRGSGRGPGQREEFRSQKCRIGGGGGERWRVLRLQNYTEKSTLYQMHQHEHKQHLHGRHQIRRPVSASAARRSASTGGHTPNPGYLSSPSPSGWRVVSSRPRSATTKRHLDGTREGVTTHACTATPGAPDFYSNLPSSGAFMQQRTRSKEVGETCYWRHQIMTRPK